MKKCNLVKLDIFDVQLMDESIRSLKKEFHHELPEIITYSLNMFGTK